MRRAQAQGALFLKLRLKDLSNLNAWSDALRVSTQARTFVSAAAVGGKPSDSIFVTNISAQRGNSPILIGLMEYFQRHEPSIGFFTPIVNDVLRTGIPKHIAVMKQSFKLTDDPRSMYGLDAQEAESLLVAGRTDELLERIWSAYTKYKQGKEFVVIEGGFIEGVPGSHMELNGRLAADLESPVLMVASMRRNEHISASELATRALIAQQDLEAQRADVIGVVANKVPLEEHALMVGQLQKRLDAAGLMFAGAIPFDEVIASNRLNELSSGLGMRLLYGDPDDLDCEVRDVAICAQDAATFLEKLEQQNKQRQHQGLPPCRPVILLPKDRSDVLLGLAAAHHSGGGPHFSGVVLTDASTTSLPNTTDRILTRFATQNHMLPILEIDDNVYDVAQSISRINPGILPDSSSKIQHGEQIFSQYIDANAIVKQLSRPKAEKLTPKSFVHRIYNICQADLQHIVLPEAMDKRVLAAAAEASKRGLARITLLGNPQEVLAQAKKFNFDITGCNILDFLNAPQRDVYAAAYAEARKSKGVTIEQALDQLTDLNVFGTMMVKQGDADGMVSGSCCTTANTIRPGMQLLRVPTTLFGGKTNVSSVFFMCLPDKVLAYGDCAVNVEPTAEELAMIAIASADTTAAFGITPRIAMLSYSTLGSGAGPQVDKVADATRLVKESRPDLLVEGPIQYDAAVDMNIAKTKIKGESEVAGRATVCIFPDLNTGNNTYKAVQQSTGAVAIGPLMQGLAKPVNDLSRGCTVADIVNTIACTAVQAIGAKRAEKSQVGAAAAAAGAA